MLGCGRHDIVRHRRQRDGRRLVLHALAAVQCHCTKSEHHLFGMCCARQPNANGPRAHGYVVRRGAAPSGPRVVRRPTRPRRRALPSSARTGTVPDHVSPHLRRHVWSEPDPGQLAMESRCPVGHLHLPEFRSGDRPHQRKPDSDDRLWERIRPRCDRELRPGDRPQPGPGGRPDRAERADHSVQPGSRGDRAGHGDSELGELQRTQQHELHAPGHGSSGDLGHQLLRHRDHSRRDERISGSEFRSLQLCFLHPGDTHRHEHQRCHGRFDRRSNHGHHQRADQRERGLLQRSELPGPGPVLYCPCVHYGRE